jgi:putative ABC transport system ATP-binding protein
VYTLTDVTKNYGKSRFPVVALRGLNLVIDDGEWLAVQGRTGHGKTTLLQILGGLDRPSAGTVTFDGQDLAELREAQVTRLRATSIGFIFQTFNLVPTLSAAENVESALIPLRVRPPERRRRVAAALESVGLADRAAHLPGELSGGQQQRVAIARALVKEPRVLLADEPTGNLDEDTRDEITALLEQLWRRLGLTLVLVTHDSGLARRAQRVAIMQHGRLSIRQDTRRAGPRLTSPGSGLWRWPSPVPASSPGEASVPGQMRENSSQVLRPKSMTPVPSLGPSLKWSGGRGPSRKAQRPLAVPSEPSGSSVMPSRVMKANTMV